MMRHRERADEWWVVKEFSPRGMVVGSFDR